jgi:NADH:ubiquinone oxidoreductase subunit E
MKKLTAMTILKETKAFVAVRALAAIAVSLVMAIFSIIGIAAIYALLVRELAVPAFVVGIIIFGGLFTILRLAKRYFLYMIKVAHISAITEYIKTGKVPNTAKGIKGVINYGTEVIKNNFGTANIAFVIDALIAGATKQIMRWLNKIQRLFSFIPGADKVLQFLNFVLATALNYIDEAILSYILARKSEKGNAFKKACDGLSYYAQSWKSMLKGAFKVAAFIWLLRIIGFLVFFIIFTAIGVAMFSSTVANFFGLVLALIILYTIEAIIVVPYSTCIMINDYNQAIKGQALKRDLHGTLCKVSGKFKSLFQKSEQPMPAEPKKMPDSL